MFYKWECSHIRQCTQARPSTCWRINRASSDEANLSLCSIVQSWYFQAWWRIFGDDAWAIVAHDLDIRQIFSHSTMLGGLYAPYASTWTCIILGCKLGQSLAAILLYQEGSGSLPVHLINHYHVIQLSSFENVDVVIMLWLSNVNKPYQNKIPSLKISSVQNDSA